MNGTVLWPCAQRKQAEQECNYATCFKARALSKLPTGDLILSSPPTVDHTLAKLSDHRNTIVQSPAHLLLVILTMERCSTPSVLACTTVRLCLVPCYGKQSSLIVVEQFCALATLAATFIFHPEVSPLCWLIHSAKGDWKSQCFLKNIKLSGQDLCMKHTRWRVWRSNSPNTSCSMSNKTKYFLCRLVLSGLARLGTFC